MGVILSTILIIFLILVIIGLFLAFIYNRLVILKNRYANAFSQIDVQLKRRYDLIPNLVEACRAYLAHESKTLEAVIAARNLAAGARQSAAGDPTQVQAMKLLADTDTALTGALGRLMMVMESYPDLKANQSVKDLTDELTSTENRVSFARQAYNDSVMRYNQAREVFPALLFVGLFGFPPAELWRLEDRAQAEPVRIDLRP
jgi:LemA protein